MTKYLNNQIIVIDTRFRNKDILNQNNANFTVKISNNNNSLKNINKIELVSMNFPEFQEAPELYYNVNDTVKNNSHFKVIVNSTEYFIQLENIFYNKTQLINNINTLMNDNINVIENLDITFKIENNKTIIECTNPLDISLNFE